MNDDLDIRYLADTKRFLGKRYRHNETVEPEKNEPTPREKRTEFMTQALARFDELYVGWVGTSEFLRVLWDIEEPNPNCWGGLIGLLRSQGRLVPTGQRMRMYKRSSHGRKTDLLRKVK